jgi:hypothetical protein
LDGCPDVVPIKDSDNDGIFDDYDECPTQSETINNYLDSDGCPDITPVNVLLNQNLNKITLFYNRPQLLQH